MLTAGGIALADLATAVGVPIPAVREGLSVLTGRLARVGLGLIDDGVMVRVAPLPFAHGAIAVVSGIESVLNPARKVGDSSR